MKIIGKVTKEEAKKIEKMVRECVNLLKKKEYELNIPNGAADTAVRCLEVKSHMNAPCRAGANLIRINLGFWQAGHTVHTEYAAFKADPIIGNIRCATPQEHYLVAVAHEVAHHIQRRYCPWVSRFKQTHKKPHGRCFQDVYRHLRRDLVNPRIKENAARTQALTDSLVHDI